VDKRFKEAQCVEVTITEIEDVKVFTPSCFKDDRGYFFETYSQRKYQPHLPDDGFVQDNESYSAERYTVRGLHYQAPPYAQDNAAPAFDDWASPFA